MGSPRLRYFGGECAKGHPLTHETAYLCSDSTLRCAECLKLNKREYRRRLGATPRRTGPDADPKRCPGCNRLRPLVEFGRAGLRKDGSIRWRTRCPACRSRRRNVRQKRERRSLLGERRAVRDWIIQRVEELRGRGGDVAVILAGLGISRATWDRWWGGSVTPKTVTIARVVDRLLPMLDCGGDALGREDWPAGAAEERGSGKDTG